MFENGKETEKNGPSTSVESTENNDNAENNFDLSQENMPGGDISPLEEQSKQAEMAQKQGDQPETMDALNQGNEEKNSSTEIEQAIEENSK